VKDLTVILLVEDLEADVFIIRKSFEKAKLPNPLQVVSDGEQAIAYLKGEGTYANRDEYPLPALILLDLKMPKIDGFEVLQWIRSHPTLRSIPVLVLTSSSQMRDVNRAYELGANSFLVKPHDFENFVATTQTLQNYWLKTVETPDSSRRPPRKAERKEQRNDPSAN
jgi:CheY-like chemotaxis protein